MKMYIDSEFKCHIANPNGVFREVVLSQIAEAFFANKCTTFIEGYRLKPEDETWVREDGFVFSGGEMITPWKPYSELDAAQREYERQLLAEQTAELEDMRAALSVMGVTT
jgi:hypothetical protein